MAEAVASVMVNLRRLQRAFSLSSPVSDEINWLLSKLDEIKLLAEEVKTQGVVSEIRDFANNIQDAIDSLIVNLIMHRHRRFTGRGATLGNFEGSMETIETTLREIRDREGHRSTGALAAKLLHKRRRDVETNEVVGFDNYSTQVIELLLKGSSSLEVVSVIGMAGLGKTTLARKVCNDNRVKNHFNRRYWIDVSTLGCREILLSLLRYMKIGVKDSGQTLEELKILIQQHSKNTRYLIVLDHIWESQVLDQVRYALPNDHNGSRILITTRLKVHVSPPILPFYLQFLTEEDSWKIFLNGFGVKKFRPWLKPLGRQIVASCKRLPLSIVTLTELLKTKEESEREWSKFVGNVSWYFTHNETFVKDMIELSYDSLPPILKTCFLYMGLFPQDYEIPFRQLVHLWAAEGFLEQSGTGSRNPEDVADDYLKELVDHSLIQVGMIRTNGSVKTCRLHDLLRNFCICEGKMLQFFEVCTDSNMITESIPSRISVHRSAPLYMSSSPWDHSSVRSFLCFGQPYNCDKNHWKWLLKHFRLLRVLDLGQVQGMSSIPEKVNKLIHLKYLRIDTKGSPINIDAICNLWNLETLDLRSSKINALPKGIHKLWRLRYLHVNEDVTLPNLSGSDDEIMSNLETLSTIALHPKNVSPLETGAFPILRKLGFSSSHNESNLGLLQRLQRLTDLSTLKIINVSGFATGRNGFPPNIAKISLVNVINLDEKSVDTLGSLPNLQILKLSGMENSSDLKCAAGDFPVLQVFQMKSLSCGNWELVQGAMPKLQRFVLKSCEHMTTLPNELWSLPALQEVVVMQPSSEMDDNLQKLKMKGENRITIYHPLAGEEKQASSD